MDNYKKCTHCKEVKHTSQYYKDKKGRYGVESLCRDCRRAKTDVQATVNRGIVAAAKYKPCHCCGKLLHPSLIDLHHLDPKEKEINISTAIYHRSATSLQNEIDKCVPVCRPCHRQIHKELNNVA